MVKAGGEVPSPSVPDGGFLSPLAELGAERNEVSADSPSATQSPKGAAARIKNLAGIRNAARQFHIDYVGKYDIAVDAVTLACSAVPKPWFTLRECGVRQTAKRFRLKSRLDSGGRAERGFVCLLSMPESA